MTSKSRRALHFARALALLSAAAAPTALAMDPKDLPLKPPCEPGGISPTLARVLDELELQADVSEAFTRVRAIDDDAVPQQLPQDKTTRNQRPRSDFDEEPTVVEDVPLGQQAGLPAAKRSETNRTYKVAPEYKRETIHQSTGSRPHRNRQAETAKELEDLLPIIHGDLIRGKLGPESRALALDRIDELVAKIEATKPISRENLALIKDANVKRGLLRGAEREYQQAKTAVEEISVGLPQMGTSFDVGYSSPEVRNTQMLRLRKLIDEAEGDRQIAAAYKGTIEDAQALLKRISAQEQVYQDATQSAAGLRKRMKAIADDIKNKDSYASEDLLSKSLRSMTRSSA